MESVNAGGVSSWTSCKKRSSRMEATNQMLMMGQPLSWMVIGSSNFDDHGCLFVSQTTAAAAAVCFSHLPANYK